MVIVNLDAPMAMPPVVNVVEEYQNGHRIFNASLHLAVLSLNESSDSPQIVC